MNNQKWGFFFRISLLFLSLNFILAAPSSAHAATVKVLTYNAFLLPRPVGTFYYNNERLEELPAALAGFDIIGLSEIIQYDAADILKAAMAKTHPYSIGPRVEQIFPLFNGGLMLFSKFPILFQDRLIYNDGSGGDVMFEKGAVFARIALTPERKIDLAITHLQSGQGEGSRASRGKQLAELRAFIRKNHDPAYPLLIMGDFNVPGSEANQYQNLLEQLDQPVDLYAEKSEERGDGFTYDGVENPLCWEKFRSRLDYIFLKDMNLDLDVREVRVNKFPMKLPVGKAKYISDHFGVEATLGF